jgi:hypothetical protein
MSEQGFKRRDHVLERLGVKFATRRKGGPSFKQVAPGVLGSEQQGGIA